MAQLTWFDFSTHNANTGDNVRAFSVNHPQAGRLVVLRGVNTDSLDALRELGFQQTRDNAWVIRASALNAGLLQQRVFPTLSLARVELDQIDLTEQFLRGAPAPEQTERRQSDHPALSWLSSNSAREDDEAATAQYRGLLPSTLAPSLWAFLENNAEATKQSNGQIHYRGQIGDRYFLVQRRQALLGTQESVVYHEANTPGALPSTNIVSQAPALYRLSDQVAPQLSEIDHFYGAQLSENPRNEFTPSRSLADVRTQNLLSTSENSEGALLQATLEFSRPLVLADGEYEPGVMLADLQAIMDSTSVDSFLAQVPSDAWLVSPQEGAQNARLNAQALAALPAMEQLAAMRGFDAILYYRAEPNASELHRDSYIDAGGHSLNVRLLDPAKILVTQRIPRANLSRVPEGFHALYGQGVRDGYIALVHTETGEHIGLEDNTWFTSLREAVAAIDAPENQPFLNPEPELLDAALNEAFGESSPAVTISEAPEPVEVIAYRGEHGENESENLFHTREGSISFSSRAVAEHYAKEPNRASDQVTRPRVIEARLNIDAPVIHNTQDPFIEFRDIVAALGRDRARTLAMALEEPIRNTQNWLDLIAEKPGFNEQSSVESFLNKYPDQLLYLYVDAYYVFDNAEWVEWFKEAGFDGAVHRGNGASLDDVEYKIFDPAQAEILSTEELAPAATQSTDPALDPERIARMAEGANRRQEAERSARAEHEEGFEERMALIDARQASWQEVDGVQVLRINDEPYLAAPATERKDARQFHIIDTRTGEYVTQVDKESVQSWLFRAGEAAAEQEEDVSVEIESHVPSNSALEAAEEIEPAVEVEDDLQALRAEAIDRLTASKSFDEAGISLGINGRERTVVYKDRDIAQLSGVINRAGVLTAIIGSMGPVDTITPNLYSAIADDESLQLAYQDQLDSLFNQRIVEVRQALRDRGYTGENYADTVYSPEGVPVRNHYTQVGAGANIVGVRYSFGSMNTVNQRPPIGEWELVDDLGLEPEEIVAEIELAVQAEAERAHAIAEQAADPDDVRGMAFAVTNTQGGVVTSGSIPELMGAQEEQANISYYQGLADQAGGSLFLAPRANLPAIDQSEMLILGMTWEELVDRQQGKPIDRSVRAVMPEGAVEVYQAPAPAIENSGTSREELEAQALEAVSGEDYYQLVDTLEETPSEDLITLIENAKNTEAAEEAANNNAELSFRQHMLSRKADISEILAEAIKISARRAPTAQTGADTLLYLIEADMPNGERKHLSETPPYGQPSTKAERDRLGADEYGARRAQALSGAKADAQDYLRFFKNWMEELQQTQERSPAQNNADLPVDIQTLGSEEAIENALLGGQSVRFSDTTYQLREKAPYGWVIRETDDDGASVETGGDPRFGGFSKSSAANKAARDLGVHLTVQTENSEDTKQSANDVTATKKEPEQPLEEKPFASRPMASRYLNENQLEDDYEVIQTGGSFYLRTTAETVARDNPTVLPQDDLFGAVEDSDTDPARSVIIKSGANPKQFLITGNGIVAIDNTLESLGGRYIKKDGGYRFKKTDENRVRRALAPLQERGEINLIEKIRTDIKLSEGLVFRINGRRHEILKISMSSYDDQLTIESKSGDSDIIVIQNIQSLEGFQGSYDLTVTNAAELERELRGGATVEADSKAPASTPSAESETTPATAPARPALRVVTPDNEADIEPATPTGRIPSSDEQEDSEEEAEPRTPAELNQKQYRLFRGQPVERLGKNREGQTLYAFTSGLRVISDDEGNLIDESPFVAEDGTFVPPAEREAQFKLLSELNAESAASIEGSGNVVALNPTDLVRGYDEEETEEESYTSTEEFDQRLAEVGIEPDSMRAYLKAYTSWRAEQELGGNNEFKLRRLAEEAGKAAHTLRQSARAAGRELNLGQLEAAAERVYQKNSDMAEKLTNGIMGIGLRRYLNDMGFISEEQARSLDVMVAKSLPPEWLHEKLLNASRRFAHGTFALMVAKVYGTTEEIEHAERVLDSGNIDRALELAQEMEQRYARTRALVEIPARIDALNSLIKNETSRSPIPNENRSRQISDLYKELARAQYDIEAIEVTDEDKQFLFEHIDGETVEHFAQKYNLSYDASRLYEERVSEAATADRRQEFIESDEFQVGIQASELVQAEMPEGVTVEPGRDFNTHAYRFAYGAGEISVTRPERDNQNDSGYRVHFRHHARFRGGPSSQVDNYLHQSYPSLPSAEQLAADTLSFAQRYQANAVKIYNAPTYGSGFSQDDNDRYNDTSNAKRIRESVKAAIASGDLPKGLKVGVRKSSGSIYLTVKALPEGFVLYNPEYLALKEKMARSHESWADQVIPPAYTVEGAALLHALYGHLNAWNYDNSDIQTDYHNVNYYDHLDIDDAVTEQQKTLVADPEAQREADNALFALLGGNEEFQLCRQLEQGGFAYDENGHRIGLRFDPGKPWVLQSDTGLFDVDAIADENGLTVPAAENASPAARMAVRAVLELRGRTISPEEATPAAESSEPSLAETAQQLCADWGLSEALQSGQFAQLRLEDQTDREVTLEVILDGGELTIGFPQNPFLSFDVTREDWPIVDRQINSPRDFLERLRNQYFVAQSARNRTSDSAPNATNESSVSLVPIEGDTLSKRIVAARQHMINEQLIPTPIAVLPSRGEHRLGLNADHSQVVLTTTLESDNLQGVIITARNYRDRAEALSALLERFERYARPALEANHALQTVEALCIIRRLESVTQARSELIDDAQRTVAEQGGNALQAYYDSLIQNGSQQAPEELALVEQVELPALTELPAWVQIGQLHNGRYVLGAQFPRPGERADIAFNLAPENPSYETKVGALAAFIAAVRKGTDIETANSCIDALSPAFPVAPSLDHDQREIPELPNEGRGRLQQKLSDQLEELKIQQGETRDRQERGDLDLEIAEVQIQLDDLIADDALRAMLHNPMAILDLDLSTVAELAREYPQVRAAYNAMVLNDEALSAEPDEQTLNQLLEQTGFAKTHAIVEVGEKSVVRAQESLPIQTLAARSYQANLEAEPQYRIDIPQNLTGSQIDSLINQARLAGGILDDAHGSRILFDSLEQLEEFTERNHYRYELTEQRIDRAPSLNTQTRNANISRTLARDLHEEGYIQGDNPNVWVIGNEAGGSVSVTFFPGIEGDTLDAELRYQNGDLRIAKHCTGWADNIQLSALEKNINAFLAEYQEPPILSPVPEPAIARITGQEACQILLGANINIEHEIDAGKWRVSGDTFGYRNTLSQLGGHFDKDGQKPAWVFNTTPTKRLAAAIAGRVERYGTAEIEENGYRLLIDTSDDEASFLLRLRRDGDDQEYAILTTSRLSTARTKILELQVDGFASLWSRITGESPTQEEQQNDHSRASEVSQPTSNENGGRTGGEQPRVAGQTGSGVSGSVAGPSRGANGSNSRRDHGGAGTGQSDRTGEIELSPGRQEADGSGAGPDDGALLRESGDRELFDLRAVRAEAEKGMNAAQRYTYDALKTLLELRKERRAPTPEEQAKLARFVGLGAGVFTRGDDTVFGGYQPHTPNAAIRNLIRTLPEEERISLKETVLSAFYTPEPIVDYMWQALERMGLSETHTKLDIVEPAVGTGNYIGGAPEYVRQNANILAIEQDKVTAEIAGLLYPEARVINKPFEQVLLPANSKDVFIGNPPYSDVRVYNPNTGKREVIHDLFLRESINALKPGGILAFITSSGTMDKRNNALRTAIHNKADLIQGLRLPTSAFKEEAGTEVMTDILVFRARLPEETQEPANWIDTAPYPMDDWNGEEDEEPPELLINQYFLDHPENVLGELRPASGRFGLTLTCKETAPLATLLPAKLAELPENVFRPLSLTQTNKNKLAQVPTRTLDEESRGDHRIGNFFLEEGEIRVVQYNASDAKYVSAPAGIKPAHQPRVLAYIELRDAAKQLIEAESEPVNEDRERFITAQRKRLNKLYDDFVEQFGPLGERLNMRLFRQDPDVFFVAQLEHYNKDQGTAEKADVLSRRVIQAPPADNGIRTPLDAVYASMSHYGHIDPGFVSEAIGEPWEDIYEGLGDYVFYEPQEGHYTTANLYLSGDVVAKREAAERAMAEMPELSRNVEALKAATPKPIPLSDIRIKLGATWIPVELVSQFARHILKADNYSKQDKCSVSYNSHFHSWNVRATDAVLRDARQRATFDYGTEHVPFHKILKHSLEQTRPKVYVEIEAGKRIVHQEATQAAQDKQREVEEAFQEWIFADPERAEQMEAAYNYQMNRFVMPAADGRYLEFPGIAKEFRGKPFQHGDHQLGVIERGLTGRYGLLVAHEAGGGKTISKVCLAMKNKQLGLARKPMIAVPNHMLVQYTTEALEIYPNARILSVSKEDLTPEGRQQFANKVRLNDWDIVICTHEQFKQMQMPYEYIKRAIDNEIGELEEMLNDPEISGDKITLKQIERQKKNLKSRLEAEYAKAEKHKDAIDFTTLGVDWIAYDESHYLKNRAFPTKNSSLAGVNSITSQRAIDAEMKFDWIREYRGDQRGVVLATGTPISNTIGELLVCLRYTAPELLERAGVSNFDAFLAAFGETRMHIELTPDGSSYQMKERLSRFHNVPELMRLFTQVADIKMGDALNLQRPTENRITRVGPQTPEQRLFMDWLTVRAAAVKNGEVQPNEDNFLKIYSELQIISVDQRLFHPGLPDAPDSKVNMEVEDIVRAWKEGEDTVSTQLIFCDRFRKTEKTLAGVNPKGEPKYTHKELFNLYDDIKQKLINKGIPAEQIAFIHDAKNDDDKEALFEDIRAGRVRVCLASTAKMGVGTNVQTRLKDLRHLSYPMRAIDIEQRNKRAVRQGNLHKEVNLHYPTTTDSGDLATLQMLDRKEKMTAQIMACDFENMERTFDEDFNPTYEDLMAITTGNEVIKDKLDTDTRVEELYRRQTSHRGQQQRALRDVAFLRKHAIPNVEEQIKKTEQLKESLAPDEGFEMVINGEGYRKAKNAGAEIHRLARKMSAYANEEKIGEYRGLPLLITRNETGYYLTLEVPGSRISTPLTENLSSFPAQLGSQITRRIQNIESMKHSLEDSRAEADELQILADKPFPHAQELEEALKRQSELSVKVMELERENAEKRPPYEAGQHPFEVLIARLDGQEVSGLLSESEIEKALQESSHEDYNEEQEETNTLTIDR